MFNRVRNFFTSRQGRNIDIDIELPLTTLGGTGDSGNIYLDSLKDSDSKIIVYAAGLGEEIDFELDVLETLKNKNVELYAFDPTPKSIKFIETQNLPSNFHFYPYAIMEEDKMVQFALPKEEAWVSGSCEDVKQDGRNFDFQNKIEVQARSIISLMNEFGHSKIDLLKMDIEGSEFNALEPLLKNDIAVEQITVDYHDYMLKNGKEKLQLFVEQIKKSKYSVFYVEKNIKKNKNLGLIRL